MNRRKAAAPLPPILQLVSPTLPIGAYAYSNGLEYAVAAGWIQDASSAHAWIADIAAHNICNLDLPVLRRLYRAWHKSDHKKVRQWSQMLVASRESAELLAEDQHMGVALARLLVDLGVSQANEWVDASEINWATMFALAAVQWQITEDDMQYGYMWAWCEHQVAAAIKLVPLGQTAGQRILFEFCERLPRLVDSSRMVKDEDIGQSSPALAIASALHEQQYSRLFRS